MGYTDKRDERRKQQECRFRNKAIVRAYLAASSCASCGFSDPRALEFDHVDPTTKTASITKLLNGTTSLARLEEEIKKCNVLCCNCHRIKTLENEDWRNEWNKPILRGEAGVAPADGS